MKLLKKLIPLIGLFAVMIVMIAGCGDSEAPIPEEVAASPANGQATIAWKAKYHVKSYNIYWSTTSGVTPANGTKISGATSPYLHTGLTNGTTYYYVVTSVNYDGESAPSPQVSAALPLSALTGVTATPGNGQVTIGWTAVPGAASYNIYWSTSSGVTPANGTKIAGATSPYLHKGLTNGNTYHYVVTAVDGNGESTPSSPASATPSTAPFIRATLLSVTGGTNPFGWLQQVSVCTDGTCNAAITDARVTLNGSTLPYNAAEGQYQANFEIPAAAAINLRVALGANVANIYTVNASQFAASPGATDLTFAKTWLHTNPNTIRWTGATSAAETYLLGIMDDTGNIVYPSPAALIRNNVLELPTNAATFTIPANSLAAGSFQLFTGVSSPGLSTHAPGTGIPIPGALSGSGLWVGRISAFIPITVQ